MRLAHQSQPGQLTIVDLSCPCVTAPSTCALFSICLDLFLEQDPGIGRIIALDEAHKYMTDSAECRALTESLLSAIRLQRHLGARVVISTQEPTISPKLLDLCSVTIAHRFTSPCWLETLRRHLAAATIDPQNHTNDAHTNDAHTDDALFSRIVTLRQGEALLFCPSAVVGAVGAVVDARRSHSKPSVPDPIDALERWCLTQSGEGGGEDEEILAVKANVLGEELVYLGRGIMSIRIRQRITRDGGRTVTAT